uniref:Uncharacterized protein n=1 Tax=Oryza meridionalis TaxID=40149 RepID=A0A0E0FD66_9ORYZ
MAATRTAGTIDGGSSGGAIWWRMAWAAGRIDGDGGGDGGTAGRISWSRTARASGREGGRRECGENQADARKPEGRRDADAARTG